MSPPFFGSELRLALARTEHAQSRRGAHVTRSRTAMRLRCTPPQTRSSGASARRVPTRSRCSQRPARTRRDRSRPRTSQASGPAESSHVPSPSSPRAAASIPHLLKGRCSACGGGPHAAPRGAPYNVATQPLPSSQVWRARSGVDATTEAPHLMCAPRCMTATLQRISRFHNSLSRR